MSSLDLSKFAQQNDVQEGVLVCRHAYTSPIWVSQSNGRCQRVVRTPTQEYTCLQACWCKEHAFCCAGVLVAPRGQRQGAKPAADGGAHRGGQPAGGHLHSPSRWPRSPGTPSTPTRSCWVRATSCPLLRLRPCVGCPSQRFSSRACCPSWSAACALPAAMLS